MKPSVAIVDGGGANIASLRCALDRLGVGSTLTAEPAAILAASHVILPGVGAADDAMRRLRARDLDTLIPALGQPVLGICLGLHLFAAESQEGGTRCLGILPGGAERLQATPGAPVPHTGWCPVRLCRRHPIFAGIGDGSHFYFVHSYALPVGEHTLAEANHCRPITAVAARRNFVAAQFHPERSAAAGARFLANFVALRP